MTEISGQHSSENLGETPGSSLNAPDGSRTAPHAVILDEFGKPLTGSGPDVNRQQEILDRVKTGERWMIVLTAVVAVATLGQVILAYFNNKSTSDQIAKIITAANGVRVASESFSKSANSINSGIGDAVSRLNTQAEALKESAEQSRRLAGATETANRNVLESERPWLGGSVIVNKFEEGEKVSMTFVFTNTGKRPAFLESGKATFEPFLKFPDNPESAYQNPHNDVPSTSFLVPGQPNISTVVADDPMPKGMMALLDSGQITYYAFSRVIYKDPRTNEEYWTHVCVYYLPHVKSASDTGFRNCNQYNDAK